MMLKKNKIKEQVYNLEEYNMLFKNQYIVYDNYSKFLKRLELSSDEIFDEIRKYLQLDNSFKIKADLENIYTQFSIIGTDCEMCLYMNIYIIQDNKDISKNEQLFLYLFNNTKELQII